MNFGVKAIKKEVQTNKSSSKAFLFFIATLIIGIVFSVISDNTATPEATAFIPTSQAKNNYSFVEATYMTEYFASDDYRNYYFVGDKDNYVYVVSVGKGKAKEYEDFIKYTYSDDENAFHEPVRFEGMPKAVGSELENIMIGSYNNIMGTDYPDDEIIQYTGSKYLEVGSVPSGWMDFTGTIMIFFSLYFLVIFSICLLATAVITSQTKKKISDIEAAKILEELKSGNKYPSCSAAVTENYIISNSFGLRVFRCDEIASFHMETMRINLIASTNSVRLYLKNGKKYRIGAVSAFSKHNSAEQQYLMSAISNMLYQRDKAQEEPVAAQNTENNITE